MRKNRGVSPLIATLLLIALTVSVTVLYTTVATDLINAYGSEDYDLPNVETDLRGGDLSVQILDKGDMSSVVIETPKDSSLDDTYLNTVGKTSTFTVKEGDTGTYSVSGLNSDGDSVLIDSIQANKSVNDVDDGSDDDNSVEDLELILLENTVKGGEDSVSFEIKNTGDNKAKITDFKIQNEGLDYLNINTETPPSRSPAQSENEVFIESNPENGFCGLPKPKSIPIDEKERFNNCQAQSKPSVADSGATMETTFNGVDANKATDYIGVSPLPKYTDMAINLYGPQDQSIRIPLSLDTFIIPKDDSYIYDKELNSGRFDSDPSTIIVREDTRITGEVKNLDSTFFLSSNTTFEDEIGQTEGITGQDSVQMQDELKNIDGSVFLGDNATTNSVNGVDSFTVGDNSTLKSEVKNLDGSVSIGDNSTVQDEIDGAGSVTVGYNSSLQDSVENLDGDVEVGYNSTINTINNVDSLDVGYGSFLKSEVNNIGGDVNLGSDITATDEVDGVSGSLTTGSNFTAQDDISNVDKDVTIGENSETQSIKTVGGDLILKDNVDVKSSISSIDGDIICGDNVETQSDVCSNNDNSNTDDDDSDDDGNNGNGNNGNGNNGKGRG